MRRGLAGRAWVLFAGLGSLLGWHGLTSGLIALVAFASGLVMLVQEYHLPWETEHEVLHPVLANWVLAPDYLGKNLADYARDWRNASEASRPALRDRVDDSLRRLGEDLERRDTQFPLINVVSMSLVRHDGTMLAGWSSRFAPGASSATVDDTIPIAETGKPSTIDLRVRYQVAPEVDKVVRSAERYYDRLIRALIGLSGASLLCFGYMVLHLLGLRERVAREAAQGATLDLADRTCHELGNVAFVVANERRNLTSHIELLERFVAEEPEAHAAAASRAGIDAATLVRFDHALKREYADRGIDPAFELRRSAGLARDVCRQIAICSDYITLTVRELDGYLKQSELPVVLGPIGAADVFEEAVALLAPRLESADARVDRQITPLGSARMVGDRRLLVHALVNLLKNAVEAASGAGIDPVIGFTVRVEGETAWLEVADNGPGISDGRLIFEDGFSTKGPGRGQGLAIVRESVRLQGGQLAVRARPGGGTIFAIGLPVAT